MLVDPAPILTERLTLIPWSRDLLRLALDDRDGLERRLSARVLPRWADAHQREILTRILNSLEVDPASCLRRFYLIMQTADRAVIGDAGFKGPPDDEGTAEIAYGVVPAYRRQGYAF